jgi:cation diffusion facilitator family transporter
MTSSQSTTENLTKWAWLSIAAALATIALKSYAYYLTGSVGLLSDAMESVVNLVAAILALIALWIAARPADDNHHFGHGKVEYFSAGAEGIMIFVAAMLIIVSAVNRLMNPEPLESLGIGLAITLVATAINGVVGVMVLRGRTTAPIHHAGGGWQAPAHRRLDVRGSHHRRRARCLDGLAAARLDRGHRRRPQHPLDRIRARQAFAQRPHGPGAAPGSGGAGA